MCQVNYYRVKRRGVFAHVPTFTGVYFVGCEGFIKIGLARDIKHRLKMAETFVPFPLEFLYGVCCEDVAAAKVLEAGFHTQFKHLRTRGEWFRDEGTIRAYLTTRRENPAA